MARSPWVKQNQTSQEDMRKAIEEFSSKGGQVDRYPEGYNPKKFIRSETAVSLKDILKKLK